jgi:hypothetical protein
MQRSTRQDNAVVSLLFPSTLIQHCSHGLTGLWLVLIEIGAGSGNLLKNSRGDLVELNPDIKIECRLSLV